MNKFVVNNDCINCRVCVGAAKENFKIEKKIAIVYKQPETQEENKSCDSVLKLCPVSAIEILN